MDISSVTQAIATLITAQTGAGQNFEGVVVERDEFVNEDPDQAAGGWIGIYRRAVTYSPLTLAAGYAGRYDLSPLRLFIVLQRADMDSGAACADKLEALVKNFIDLLLANDSLSNTIERIARLDIEYGYDPKSRKGELYVQSAYMTLDLEVANG